VPATIAGHRKPWISGRIVARIVLPILLLALPLIEIAGFALVGREIGVLATVALVIASALIGSILLRWQGFGVIAKIRRDIDAGRDPGRQLAHGVMILIAGILLIIPGFFTDIVGLLLFLPPVRDIGWRLVRDRVKIVGDFGVFQGGADSARPRRGGPTIDLGEEEYSRTRNPDSPWRRIDDET
jgi:UPF0716 protein FxsA